jgi:hypothetical protein
MGPGLQEWIHKLEVAEGARLVKILTAWLALAGLVALYDWREFRNFHSAEAMDAAQVARNLAEGRGFSTKFIRPLSIHLLERRANEQLAALPPDAPKAVRERFQDRARLRGPHPDLANPPVYPALLAGLMKTFSFDFEIPKEEKQVFRRYAPEIWITFFNQFWFVVAVMLAFFLARRLFDDGVAWLTAILLVGSDLLWRFSVSGLPTPLLMVILLGVVWCLVLLEQETEAEQPRGTAWFVTLAVAAGALVGVGMMTRYAFGWLLAPVLGFLLAFFGARRWLVCGAALVAFLVVVTPWLVRNYDLGGTLFGTAGFALQEDTLRFPGNRLPRALSPDFSLVALGDYARKLAVNVSQLVREDFPKFGGSWVSAFFLVGLLVPFISRTLGRLRLFVLACVAVLALAQALGRTHLSADTPEVNSENLLVLLVPLVFAYGVSLYFVLLEQVRLPFPELQWMVNTLFVALACVPLLLTLLPPPTYPVVYPPYYPPLIQQVGRWLRPDEWMMSDMPWAVAWYGDRHAVWVTLGYERESDFYAIHDFRKPIHALYLTPLTTDAKLLSQMIRNQEHAWGRFLLDSLMRTNVPTGFPLQNAPRGFLPDQLFLTDWERWREQHE